MKKKILFLSPLPPPDYGSAISSKMCLKLLEEVKRFKVKNIKLNYSQDMSDIGKINFSKVRGIFMVKEEIKKKIKNFKPDIIYFVPATQGLGFIRDYFFIKQIRKFWKGEILFHVRSRILEKYWNNFFFKTKIRKIFENQKTIILGEELKKDIHNLPKEIFVLPNAIENEFSTREFKKIMIRRDKDSKLKILFLSNMDPQKGWLNLLKACKILNEKKINFECNFVGEWVSQKDRVFFKKFVNENNLFEKVKYLGKMKGKNKKKIFLNSNLFVFPTEYKLEACPRVVLEAMMFGLPVISNKIGAIPSLVLDNKNGFLLNKNTSSEIAMKIIKLKEKSLRKNMGFASRKKFINNHNLKNYKKKFLKIFERI